jgi:hypothetical protein
VYTVTPITEAKGESKEEEKEKKKYFQTKDNEKKGILINSSLVVFVLYVVCVAKYSCVRFKNSLVGSNNSTLLWKQMGICETHSSA